MSVTEARSMILNMMKWDFQYSSQIDSVAQGLMRYRLIDILADVLGCEKHLCRKSFAPTAHPALPASIQSVGILYSPLELLFYNNLKIKKSLGDWPKTVAAFGQLLSQGVSSRFSALNTVFVPSSSPSFISSLEQIVFQTGIFNLVYASRHSQDIKFHKVMVNVQLVVFALCWFGMVRCSLYSPHNTQVV